MKKTLSIIFSLSILLSCQTSKDLIKVTQLETIFYNGIESGSHIKLKKGTYKLEIPIQLLDKKDIILDGNGSTLIMQSMSDDVIYIQNSSNITIMNFKATHIEPTGPVGCTGNVVHIEGGENISIQQCELNGSGIVGIAAYYTKDLMVLNNHIHKNSEYGIIYQGPQIEIRGNTFENNGNGNIYYSYQSTSWPPNHLINSDENKKGLTMSNNTFN